MKLPAFRINEWLVEPQLNSISGPTGRTVIGSTPMKLLVELITHQGEVVSKESLYGTVWLGVNVNEETIRKTVSTLRQHFAVAPECGIEIETIRSIGYRLVSEVRQEAEDYRLKSLLGFAEQINIRRALPYVLIFSFCVALFVLWSFSVSEKVITGAISVGPTIERVPRISGNGREMLVARRTGQGINLDIVKYDLVRGGYEPITALVGLETDPIWSPDDQKVAFLQRMDDVVSMYEIDLASKKNTLLTRTDMIPNLSAMDWSPNGKSIAFSNGLQGRWPFVISQLDHDLKEKEQLTFPNADIIGDVNPRYSPSGDKLAFLRCTKDSRLYGQFIQAAGDIHTVDLSTGDILKLTDIDDDITGIDWSDNGDELYYIDIEDHFNFRVNALSMSKMESRVVHQSDHLLRNIDVKGDVAVFEEWSIEFQIIGFNKKKRQVVDRLSEENQKFWFPKLNHKADALAYISNESGRSELWIKDLGTGLSRQMTNFEGPLICSPSWSPNDDKIVVAVFNESDDIYLIDVNTSKITRLGSSKMANYSAVFSKNGTSVLYSSQDETNSEIWEYNLKDSTDIKVVDLEVTTMDFSNGVFYYTRKDKNGLWSYDTSLGLEKLIIPRLHQMDKHNWLLLGNSIYFNQRIGGKSLVYKYSLTDSAMDLFHTFNGNLSTYFPGISVSEDETLIYSTFSGPIFSEIKLIEL